MMGLPDFYAFSKTSSSIWFRADTQIIASYADTVGGLAAIGIYPRQSRLQHLHWRRRNTAAADFLSPGSSNISLAKKEGVRYSAHTTIRRIVPAVRESQAWL